MAFGDKDSVALVTGCSAGGMGYYLAKSLADRGWRVFGTSRRETSIDGLDNVEILAMDVTSSQSVKNAIAELERRAGKLDLVINNAGAGGGITPLLDVDIDKSFQVYDANVFGVLRVVQSAARLMLKDGPVQFASKRIINIGSIAGYRSVPFNSIYCSSKGALHNMSDSLRVELRGLGIAVVVIAPGVVATKFSDNMDKAMKPLPDDSFYRGCWDRIMDSAADARKPGAIPADSWAEECLEKAVLVDAPSNYYTFGSKFEREWFERADWKRSELDDKDQLAWYRLDDYTFPALSL